MVQPVVDREAMVALFQELQSSFPDLAADLDLEAADDGVDIYMLVRAQHHLGFDVTLRLQGDELHMSAGAFWLEWFPCTRSDVVDAYREAVVGLLSGEYRIREHYIGNEAVKAQLQRPTQRGWRTVGTWSNLGAFIPWPRRKRILQAAASST